MVGLIGILFFDPLYFAKLTTMNLLLTFLLLVFTQDKPRMAFFSFAAICFFVGIVVEIIGTQTGYLFGEYSYGDVLGPEIQGVPWIIGVNWFIVIYCTGITVSMVLNKIIDRVAEGLEVRPKLKTMSVIVDGATLAVMFDFLIEPVAVKLGYWQWGGDGSIPFFNYLCWFGVSLLLLAVFQYFNFSKRNKFAVNLLLIQAMFFLLLRTFL